MEYGLQMYSLHDIMMKEMAYSIDELSKIGYKFIETCGFHGLDAKQFKEVIDRNGIWCIGTHTIWQELLPDKLKETIEFRHQIGCKAFVIPVPLVKTREEVDAMIKAINDSQKILRSEGIELYFHNHIPEFFPNENGICIFDELKERTEIKFELDTYWVFEAGMNPTEKMEELRDRIDFIHVRDGDGHSVSRVFGEGVAPLKDIYNKARDLGFKMIVETEPLPPSGLETAKKNFEYLKKLEAEYEK